MESFSSCYLAVVMLCGTSCLCNDIVCSLCQLSCPRRIDSKSSAFLWWLHKGTHYCDATINVSQQPLHAPASQVFTAPQQRPEPCKKSSANLLTPSESSLCPAYQAPSSRSQQATIPAPQPLRLPTTTHETSETRGNTCPDLWDGQVTLPEPACSPSCDHASCLFGKGL